MAPIYQYAKRVYISPFVILASDCQVLEGCGMVRAGGGCKKKQTWITVSKIYKGSKSEHVELDFIITDKI